MIISTSQKPTTFEEAYNELSNDYSEEEIRLVRIKFISEMAN